MLADVGHEVLRPRLEFSPAQIAAELLALSKMNWNATQLDGKLPITVRTADRIGSVLKHLGQGEEPAPRYAFYM
jgi:argonaute-like protein implicated in RNA metabolism and viral defense